MGVVLSFYKYKYHKWSYILNTRTFKQKKKNLKTSFIVEGQKGRENDVSTEQQFSIFFQPPQPRAPPPRLQLKY